MTSVQAGSVKLAQLAGIAICQPAPMLAAACTGIVVSISGKRCPAEHGRRLPVCRAEPPGRPDHYDRPISQHEPDGGTSIGPEPVPVSRAGGRYGLLLVVRKMEPGAQCTLLRMPRPAPRQQKVIATLHGRVEGSILADVSRQ